MILVYKGNNFLGDEFNVSVDNKIIKFLKGLKVEVPDNLGKRLLEVHSSIFEEVSTSGGGDNNTPEEVSTSQESKDTSTDTKNTRRKRDNK